MGGSLQPLTDDVPAGQAFDLTDRIAVLTGAASGIGRATALVLSGAGATVVLGDIDGPGVEATVKEIDRRGGRAVGVEMDVTRRADVDALVARATGDYGRIDVMGNIAGVRSDGPVVDITDGEFDRVLDINLRGVFYGCQAALRAMIPQGSGNIINISSGIVDDPGPTMAAYGMTKAAVAALTKAIAAEGAVHGIRANAIAPGVILSNFSRAHFVDDSGEVDPVRYDAYLEWAAGMAPLARVGMPAEVAWMILYLVSDAASFVTGQILRPNGGTSMPW
ncbi:MAG: SDR family NAD(P)-dependent oxidoreductase [Acidimicrobiales bacterium]|jgi:3-oxoacyl-[acyl-carrier protein] reductase